MARPVKFRRIEFFPKNSYFMPSGKQKSEVREVTLKVEEVEAMRLKDVLGLNQEECAKKMRVSRQTFQNIIDNARRNVAIALTEGKAISIEGGSYTTNDCEISCKDCGHTYEINSKEDQRSCPSCSSNNISCKKISESCRKWCRIRKE